MPSSANCPAWPILRDELKASGASVAASIPRTALKLGKAANEQTVKSTDLAKYQIIAFATHGLVPGDLDGLTQPALALTAPDVAGVAGRRSADRWKKFSPSSSMPTGWCSRRATPAAGAVAGAEAASGLGRAFFYAGTRALLVTNWSVQSRLGAANWCPICSAARLPTPTLTRARGVAAGDDGAT